MTPEQSAAIVAQVNAEIVARRGVLPPWQWPMLGPYNGWTGAQRVVAWQYQTLAKKQGLLPWPKTCEICGGKAKEYHNEDYGNPFCCHAVCVSDHRALHKRFNQPGPWKAIVKAHAKPGVWFANLPMTDGSRPSVQPVAQEVLLPPSNSRIRPLRALGLVSSPAPVVQPSLPLGPIRLRTRPK